MAKNKLYNKSYFSKRLRDAGYEVIKLSIPYQGDDFRKWTIVVNPGKQCIYRFNIFVTCFKDDQSKQFSFKFQGQNFEDFLLETKSMKLIIRIFDKTCELFDFDKSGKEQKTAFNSETINQLKQEEENKNENK